MLRIILIGGLLFLGGCSIFKNTTDLSIEVLDNNNESISNATCSTLVGSERYDLKAPYKLTTEISVNDKLYIHCKKPGYLMVADADDLINYPKIAQTPTSMREKKFNEYMKYTMINFGFSVVLGIPVVLLSSLSYGEFVGGVVVLSSGFATANSIRYVGEHKYPAERIRVKMIKKEDLTKEYQVIEFDPEEAKYFSEDVSPPN